MNEKASERNGEYAIVAEEAGSNILEVVRKVGDRIRLQLGRDTFLEITPDEVRWDTVRLVLAVSGPFVFAGGRGRGER